MNLLKAIAYCIFLSVIISLCCTVFDIIVFNEGIDRQYYIEVNMKSSVNSIAQLYYDTGRGYRSKESFVNRVTDENAFKKLKFVIPRKDIYRFQFSPIKTSGKVVIKSIRLLDTSYDVDNSIDINSVKQLDQIKRLKVRRGFLHIKTKNKANNPLLQFEIDYPVKYSYIKKIFALFINDLRKIFILFALSFTAISFLLFSKIKPEGKLCNTNI